MNNQATIDVFFKNQRKRKSLHLRIKPKSSRMSVENLDMSAPIEISDDEGTITDRSNNSMNTTTLNCSDTSGDTEPYSLDSFIQTPSKAINTTETPTKVSPSRSLSTPKYFSPSKKRCISLKTSPGKVKRNLNYALKDAIMVKADNENEFYNYTEGLDDNTKFLLTIIHNYLQGNSLRPLLDEKSAELLKRSLSVMKPGMRIVCRLFWRHGVWYRLDNIKKIAEGKSNVEGSAIHEVLNSLIEQGFLDTLDPNDHRDVLTYDELVDLLKADELKDICKWFKLKVSKKEEAKHALRKFCKQKVNIKSFFVGGGGSANENRVMKALKTKVGCCYKLTDLARITLKELYILMFLGMDYSIIRENQLELTLLNEKTNRETYPLPRCMVTDNASVVFKDRQEFEGYLRAHDIYEEFLATVETVPKCGIVKRVYDLHNAITEEQMESYTNKSQWLLRFTPPYVYVKVLEEGIQYLKKDKVNENLDLAVKILTLLIKQNTFRQHKKAGWYSEKALIVDKLLLWPDEAASILLEGFEAGLPEESLEVLKVRAKLLVQRKTNCVTDSLKGKLQKYIDCNDVVEKNIRANHIYKVPMCSPGRGKIKFETRTERGVNIQDAEEYCIDYYINGGKYTHGGHWEGRILMTIFFLLFWDIIYNSIQGLRGIFLSHYQVFPLDMFTDSFYRNRKTLIDEKLKEIKESTIEDLIEKMESVWNSRPENELSGINRSITWAQVAGVCTCLGTGRISSLVRRLALTGGRTQSGVPDLTMWNELTREITFVEVKTDTDKPSIKQILWMHYMKQHGVDTEFCYVGVNTTRCKARNRD
ncbi:fanconi-associated nuclease 1-like [Danaus plexippus]|uniref:fanconi-associated nuclease 1-like n=1 Tax=Danaus plexippus TaxID=13037 RepID=UPI002AB051C8|nr:fanconi-associated nuclease 1-like [Danaus plexippus]XP_061384113.1 fanconi-associated nuclease 1-like [Danaus plexippus]